MGERQGIGGLDREDEILGDRFGILSDRSYVGKADLIRKKAPEPLVDLYGVQAPGIVPEIFLRAIPFFPVIEEALPGRIFPGAGPDAQIPAELRRNPCQLQRTSRNTGPLRLAVTKQFPST
jgi:hypothetical protein